MVRSWSTRCAVATPALDQRLRRAELGLGGGELRPQGLDLRVVGGYLEADLLVPNGRDALARGDAVALGDEQLLDDPADAGAGRHLVARRDACRRSASTR